MVDSCLLLEGSVILLADSSFSTSAPWHKHESAMTKNESGTKFLYFLTDSFIAVADSLKKWYIHFLLWRIHFSYRRTQQFRQVLHETYMNQSLKNMNPSSKKWIWHSKNVSPRTFRAGFIFLGGGFVKKACGFILCGGGFISHMSGLCYFHKSATRHIWVRH